MFHAVRLWWSGGRGKVTVRLFLFEFVVVVAGVLTAQSLANWVSARHEDRAIREENERVRYEIGRARQVARIWMKAAPCLLERVDTVIRRSSSGGVLDAGQSATPLFIGYSVEPLKEDMRRAFGERFGVAQVDNYALVSTTAQSIGDSFNLVRLGWDRFALMDSSLGPVTQADRAAVKDAAIQVRAHLGRIKYRVGWIESTADRLGIPARTSDANMGSARPVTNCNQIWQSGQVWREGGD